MDLCYLVGQLQRIIISKGKNIFIPGIVYSAVTMYSRFRIALEMACVMVRFVEVTSSLSTAILLQKEIKLTCFNFLKVRPSVATYLDSHLHKLIR